MIEVQLSGAVNGVVAGSGEVFGRIVDDDPLPQLVPGGGGGVEGAAGGSGVVQVPIRLDAPSGRGVSVDYQTLATSGIGHATSGVDFVPTSGTVTFEPGETVQTVAVTVLGDDDAEVPLLWGEWLFVRFFAPPQNATLDLSFYGLGVGVIIDDD